MRDLKALFLLLISLTIAYDVEAVSAESTASKQVEIIQDSLVCLVISTYSYNAAEPWKRRSLADRWVCGAAVGPYQVLTSARGVANHTFMKALRHGQAEFIRASAKVVDYESDLCLIDLDADELQAPLKTLRFAEIYAKGQAVTFHWLGPDSSLNSGQGYLDRAHLERVRTSYGQRLRYVIANTSQKMGTGGLCCLGTTPIGIGCWAGDNREADLIPSETIVRFLDAVAGHEAYQGFGEIGFAATGLRDPALRSSLQMPRSQRGGVYVSNVYTLGTGADSLLKGDVILEIDGHAIDAHGRYTDPIYGPLAMEHLVTRKAAGQDAQLKLWRKGDSMKITVPVRTFKPSEMLVPFQEYDRQPEYTIIGGFIFQKLTREYLLEFGKNLAGLAPSHLYHYYRDQAFKPTDERSSIMVLNHVLPTPANLGYGGLRELVVSTFNGQAVNSVADVEQACKLNPESPHHIVTFEMDAPTAVISRAGLSEIDRFVSENYGIQKLSNSHP